MSWSTLFSAIPQETSDAADSMEYIRDLKVASREVLVNGHVFDLATQATQGRHLQGSLYTELSTSEPNASTEKTDHGRIHLDASTGLFYGAFWDEDEDEIVWRIIGNKDGFLATGDDETYTLAELYTALYAALSGTSSEIPFSGGITIQKEVGYPREAYNFLYAWLDGTDIYIRALYIALIDTYENAEYLTTLHWTSSSSDSNEYYVMLGWDLTGR
jgi:hypothetical protein